jgi:hypothetical protein
MQKPSTKKTEHTNKERCIAGKWILDKVSKTGEMVYRLVDGILF